MHAQILFSSLVLASCFVNPSREASPPHASSASAAIVSDPFPVPKEGLSVKVSADGKPTMAEFVEEFSRVSGEHLLINKETNAVLKSLPTGLTTSVDVPPQEVYSFVEAILAHNDFVLTRERDTEPRLMGVVLQNSSAAGGLRSSAIWVSEKDIAGWARHPAILVTTTVSLPNLDVRTLSNSMRSIFTDANTQQIIPVGNSSGLILTGFGSEIARLVTMLKAMDEMEKTSAERMKKEGAEQPALKPAAPKEKEGKKD